MNHEIHEITFRVFRKAAQGGIPLRYMPAKTYLLTLITDCSINSGYI